jgi:hypothetical protein
VAQVARVEDVEPLPDIDFNIRAGNTLVGYVKRKDVKRALTFEGEQGKLMFAEEADALQRFEERAADVERLFGLFRQQQTELGGQVTAEDKAELRRRLDALDDELNRALASEYGIEPKWADRYQAWLKSHRPLHWFVEFYGIMRRGGFDVVIGNPPYVEYRLVREAYKLPPAKYRSEPADNLYAYCMERAGQLLNRSGWFGMIVPAGVLGLDDAFSLRHFLLGRFSTICCSTYAIRPSKLFDGVDQRLCIFLGVDAEETRRQIWTTRYHHWNSEERDSLFALLQYCPSFNHDRLKRIPQVGTKEAAGVLAKIETRNNRCIANYYSAGQHGFLAHYHRSPRYWIRSMDFEQYFKSATRTRSVHHFRDLYFRNEDEGKFICATLNSSLYFFWFVSVGNGRNITGTDVEQFPIGALAGNILAPMSPLFDRLMADYSANSFVRARQDCEYQEFRPSLSKPILDEIDRILARHYGFTDEELDFIINYDIKYRMGDELEAIDENE